MPIKSVADFQNDLGEGEGGVDGTKLPPFGPGGIYHEKQIGALCAVHAINNLLQGPLFDEGVLAEHAHALDQEERRLLGGGPGLNDGGNVRADGFFNVQVIKVALQRAGYEMERINSESGKTAKLDPKKQHGFICNKREHWFALRRIGREWFDLNSCLRTPKHFTDSDLEHNISEATREGYAVFAVTGSFPRSALEDEPDKLLEAVRGCGHAGQGHCLFAGRGQTLGGDAQPAVAADPDLLAAAAADPELAAAIKASLESAAPAPAQPKADDMDEIRRKRLARFG